MVYDVQTYLLDRANIHDTITKLCHAYDTRSPETLAAEVYAREIGLDYRAFFGAASPDRADAAEWSRKAVAVLEGMTATQHVLCGVAADLPQPSAAVAERPKTCKARADVLASLVREGVRGGGLMQNGGYYEFELVRLPELEEQGRNPWRISFHKAVAVWENGNWAVFNPPDMPPIYPKAGGKQ